jgi:hypothetical protein
VGVKITTGSSAVVGVKLSQPEYKPKTLKRDRRIDPLEDKFNCRKVLTMATPTRETLMLAWHELLPMVNLVPYYTEDWDPIFKRHGAMYDATQANKVKDFKGLLKQVVEAYKKVMKTGKWQPGPWGQEEPK